MAVIANPLALDVDDACLLTGASRYLLRDSIRSGDLPARRLGRQVLIRFSDLEKWVDGLPPLHSVEERPK
jgi:excisionase family DNA binding protein